MVQGASQSAGRFPDEQRMYKAPPPEVSSEQFYETDEDRGFARGFSIQTISPLPIGWAEHVIAEGHFGRELREYMRDYNHWTTIGVLNELLPQPENRVTLAEEKDPYGIPVAHFSHSRCENDKANMEYSKKILKSILQAAGAQDTLTIQRYAHLIGGARMGSSPEDSVVDSDHRVWDVAEPVHRRRQRLSHAGQREPSPDDHGALLPPGGATGEQAGPAGPHGGRAMTLGRRG